MVYIFPQTWLSSWNILAVILAEKSISPQARCVKRVHPIIIGNYKLYLLQICTFTKCRKVEFYIYIYIATSYLTSRYFIALKAHVDHHCIWNGTEGVVQIWVVEHHHR